MCKGSIWARQCGFQALHVEIDKDRFLYVRVFLRFQIVIETPLLPQEFHDSTKHSAVQSLICDKNVNTNKNVYPK